MDHSNGQTGRRGAAKSTVLMLHEDLAFDPLLGTGGQLIGFHMRRAGDSFNFKPLPNYSSMLTLEDGLDPLQTPNSFVITTGPLKSKTIPGIRIALEMGRSRHSLVLPKVATGYERWIAWSIDTSVPKHEILAVIGQSSPLVKVFSGTKLEGEIFDLSDGEPAHLSVKVGDALGVGTLGDYYAFILLFRLVGCTQPDLELGLKSRQGILEIFCHSPTPVRASFLITASPRKDFKFVGGSPSASVRLSELALSVYEPFPPRFFLDISGAVTSILDRPLSRNPILGRPGASFPLIFIGTDAGELWPTVGDSSRQILTNTIKGIVYFGTPPRSIIEKWIWSRRMRFVGLVSTKPQTLLASMPMLSGSRAAICKGDAVFIAHGDQVIGGLFLKGKVFDCEKVDEFLVHATQQCRTDLPPKMVLSWREHVASRLPALPFCRDLAVAMALAVGNRQRGRCMRDQDDAAVSYDRLADDGLWLCPWRASAVIDRDDLLLEIALRTTAEYLAVRVYARLVQDDRHQASESVSKDLPSSIEIAADAYVVAWEHVVENGRAPLRAAQEALLTSMARYDPDGRRTQSAIAAAFLERFRGKLAGHIVSDEGLTRINPLVLVLATGGDETWDLPLELASTYWAAYAAGFSGGKPGAIVASLIHRSEISEALRRQHAIRVAIRYLDSSNDVQLLDLRIKRQRLGQLVQEKLQPASLKLLRAADADRIVACSPVVLDFVPFGSSLLGLERPLSRLPVSDDIAGNYATINLAAVSSAAHRGSGIAAILFPTRPRDDEERWAARFGEAIQSMMPLLGFRPNPMPQSDASVVAIIDHIRSAELVIFVGHGIASDSSAFVDLGTLQLSCQQLREIEWTGKLAMLIGCETAALDTNHGDAAGLLLQRGARAVVGTTAQVEIDVAQVFFEAFLNASIRGDALDYAFFQARRQAVIAEALRAKGLEWSRAAQRAREIALIYPSVKTFASLLAEIGMTWDEAYTSAVFSLSWSITGGAAERLR
jgi:hypothetical protein